MIKSLKIVSLSICLLLLSCDDTLTSPYPDIVFQSLNVPEWVPRISGVSFVIQDKAYLALGRPFSGNYFKTCCQYDPANNQWSKLSDFPGNTRVKAVAAVVGDKAYVGLGFGQGTVYQGIGYYSDFWEYNPANDSWTQKANFPGLYRDACVAFTYNNFVIVGSGFDGNGSCSEFWKYDPTTDKWTRLNNFTGSNRSGAVACANGTSIYFGTGYKLRSRNDWWQYDATNDHWTEKQSMPDNGRENAISLCIDNRFFVSTGRYFGGSDGILYSDIMEYNPTKDGWYKRGQIPNGGRENATAFVIGKTGYIGFGEDNNEMKTDLYRFEP